jgi:hypothetical protein
VKSEAYRAVHFVSRESGQWRIASAEQQTNDDFKLIPLPRYSTRTRFGLENAFLT